MSMLVRHRPRLDLVAVDVAIAGVLAAIGIAELRSVGDDIFYRAADGFGVALVIAQTAPLVLRRVAPIPVTALICGAAALSLWIDYPETNALLAVPLALYSVAAVHARRTTAVVVAAALVVIVPPLALSQHSPLSFLVVAVVVFAVGAFAGDGVRSRRLYAEALELRAEQARQEQRLEAREAVVAERSRIARDLHDAIGHTVNVMVMHAGAGRLTSAQHPEKSVEALRAIEELGRATLGDIDRLLGLLRDDDETSATRRPAAGIREIPALVDRIAAAGLTVTYEHVGPDEVVAGPVDVAIYRIVQESLTNALKHSPGSTVQARVTVDDDDVHIEVVNTAPAALLRAVQPVIGGRGLIGMRERVAALGGSIRTGSCADGGFSVVATIPLRRAHVERRPDRADDHEVRA